MDCSAQLSALLGTLGENDNHHSSMSSEQNSVSHSYGAEDSISSSLWISVNLRFQRTLLPPEKSLLHSTTYILAFDRNLKWPSLWKTVNLGVWLWLSRRTILYYVQGPGLNPQHRRQTKLRKTGGRHHLRDAAVNYMQSKHQMLILLTMVTIKIADFE